MKRLLMTAALICTGTIASAQSLEELLNNPYWTIDNYTTAFCEYRGAFYANAEAEGIEFDANDETMELFHRENFDLLIAQGRISVIGERPAREEFICP